MDSLADYIISVLLVKLPEASNPSTHRQIMYGENTKCALLHYPDQTATAKKQVNNL